MRRVVISHSQLPKRPQVSLFHTQTNQKLNRQLVMLSSVWGGGKGEGGREVDGGLILPVLFLSSFSGCQAKKFLLWCLPDPLGFAACIQIPLFPSCGSTWLWLATVDTSTCTCEAAQKPFSTVKAPEHLSRLGSICRVGIGASLVIAFLPCK